MNKINEIHQLWSHEGVLLHEAYNSDGVVNYVRRYPTPNILVLINFYTQPNIRTNEVMYLVNTGNVPTEDFKRITLDQFLELSKKEYFNKDLQGML